MKHIVIGSIPRSGSTFVQRSIHKILPDASTGPESWYLPRVGDERRFWKSYSELGANTASTAVNFYRSQGFSGTYNQSAFNGFVYFLDTLSEKTGGRFFIEKTPRNLFFLDEMVSHDSLMPIQVVRRPLDILLSYVFTFSRGFLFPKHIEFDLYRGCEQLLINRAAGVSSIIYENIIKDDLSLITLLSNNKYKIGKNTDIGLNMDQPGILGDPIFQGSNKYKANRLQKEKISPYFYRHALRFMKDPSVVKIYYEFYNHELYLEDIQKLKKMLTLKKSYEIFVNPIINLYFLFQLNILKQKRISFFLR